MMLNRTRHHRLPILILTDLGLFTKVDNIAYMHDIGIFTLNIKYLLKEFVNTSCNIFAACSFISNIVKHLVGNKLSVYLALYIISYSFYLISTLNKADLINLDSSVGNQIHRRRNHWGGGGYPRE